MNPKTENRKPKTRQGFTLIELLIVIGIIGFLAASVLVAVDPVKRIQDARDARRYSEANALLNAVLNKQVDARTIFNGDVTAPIITQVGTDVQVIVEDAATVICNNTATRPGCNRTMDVDTANKDCVAQLQSGTAANSLVPDYIAAIPRDPRGTGSPCIGGAHTCTSGLRGDFDYGVANSGYYIARTAGSRIEIGSCKGEQTLTISVKR